MTILELLGGNCGCSSVVILVSHEGPSPVSSWLQTEDLSFIVNLNWFTPLQGKDGADNSSITVIGP